MGLPKICIALMFFLNLVAAGASYAKPSKIVSLNMCADQYLIALADKEQVAALTQHARDPSLSYFAQQAHSYPVTKGSAEEVLNVGADLVIASPYRRAETRALLARFDLPVLEVGPASNFDEIVQQTRLIAAAIGQSERGEALIRRMKVELREFERPAGTPKFNALHYQRRGFLTGSETLLSEIMERAGLLNIAGQIKATNIGRVSLEVLLRVKPDYLVTNIPIGETEDLGTELLDHPILKRFYDAKHYLYLPQAMTVCGGPSFSTAILTLKAQLGGQSVSDK